MLTSFVAALGLLSSSASAEAAGLRRQAGLGITMAAADRPDGVLIEQIAPGGNADRLRMRAGDLLVAVNGTPVRNRAAVAAATSGLREGDMLTVSVARGGRTLSLSGTATGKPLETYPNADVEYGSAPFENAKLRTIIARPAGWKDGPVVYFIQGYPCAPVEGGSPDHSYTQLLGHLLAKGIAVYRIDKPGAGDSGGPACSSIGFDQEVRAFAAGYRHLIGEMGIPAERIFLFGHSMGGLEAPLLAAQGPAPRGIALFGGVVRNWRDYQQAALSLQSFELFGNDPVAAMAYGERARPVADLFFTSTASPEELARGKPETAELMRSALGWTEGDQMAGRHFSYWREIAATPLAPAWRDALSNVLVLYGESDIVAVNDEDHRLIAEIVNHYRPGTARYVPLSGTEHGMKFVGDRAALRVAMKDPRRLRAAPFDTRVTDRLADWINESMQAPPVAARFQRPIPASQD